MTPTKALIDWLNTDATLLASATGGVWEDPGPPTDTRPFVTVRLLSGPVDRCGGGSRQIPGLYAVKAVGMVQDLAAVRAACERIDVLIGKQPRILGRLDLEGFEVVGCWPEELIEYADPEVVTGIRYEHRGANYRLTVAPTAVAA